MNPLVLLFLIPGIMNFTNIRINSDTDPVLPFHNEHSIVINPQDTLNLVASWRDFRQGYHRIGIGVSFDGGITWEDRLLENREELPRDADPVFTTDKEGNIYLSTISFRGDPITQNPPPDSSTVSVFVSSDGGVSFQGPYIASASSISTFEDKEFICCDRTSSANEGNLYVTWTRFAGSLSLIKSAFSTDGGLTWSAARDVSDNPGVQWSVPCVGKDGTLYVAWLRFISATTAEAAIMLDRSHDEGATWGQDMTLDPLTLGQTYIDGWIGTFSHPAMDADITNGPYGGNLYIAYMDQGANGSTDIFFIRSTDGGESWSTAVPIVGEDVPDNDQFHPWLIVDNLGVIHVVFYDQRNGIEDDLLDLYYVYSEDGGGNWSEPIRISDEATKPTTLEPFTRNVYGEYVGLAAYNGRPYPVWTDCRDGGIQNIYFGSLEPAAVAESPVDVTGGLEAVFVSEGIKVRLSSPAPGDYRFNLYDASGRKVFRKKKYIERGGSILLDIGKISKGIYLLEVEGEGFRKAVKLVELD
ncbi:exo-alpha-sialidase [candidate division WOR-3 bacterium]|nr:exo-alpha-sialidase [candidate division WOR-3 bacterium]